MSESDEMPVRPMGPIAIAFEGGLAALALAICWYAHRWPPVAAGPWAESARLLVWGLLATLPMIAGLIALDRYPIGPLGELKRFVETHLAPLFAQTSLTQMAIISLAAGFGEELLFRGLLQTAVADWIGPPYGLWIGLVAASLAFGLAHSVTTTYAVLAALMGLYFGLLFIATGDLLPPMIAHGLYDFVALIYLAKRKPPTPQSEPGPQTRLPAPGESEDGTF